MILIQRYAESSFRFNLSSEKMDLYVFTFEDVSNKGLQMKALPLTPPSHKVCFTPRKGQLDALLRSKPPKTQKGFFTNCELELNISVCLHIKS